MNMAAKRAPRKHEQVDIAKLHRPTPIESRKIEILNRHWSRIYKLAELVAGSATAAEQITAGTFIEMRYRLELSDRENADQAFVQKIGKILPLNPVSVRPIFVKESAPIPQEMLVQDLKRVLPQLPATERLLFILRFAQGYEPDYIAWLLGVDESAVDSGSFLALMRVRELLGK